MPYDVRALVAGERVMRILVTAGPTREYFDTVRFISNASTGKLGYAVARAAHERGHVRAELAVPSLWSSA